MVLNIFIYRSFLSLVFVWNGSYKYVAVVNNKTPNVDFNLKKNEINGYSTRAFLFKVVAALSVYTCRRQMKDK